MKRERERERGEHKIDKSEMSANESCNSDVNEENVVLKNE